MKYRTRVCGELTGDNKGEFVKLSGWVHRYRDHGGVIFVDLRDRYGITQLVCRSEENSDLHMHMSQLRSEWVIEVEGIVNLRMAGMENKNLITGMIEINIDKCRILSKAEVPPFSICDENIKVNEDLRLQYRYLDMRRGRILDRLVLRHRIVLACRNFMDSEGFVEVTTPVLGKSTPEGARDYLVPSRIYPGRFYALPQSPQIFKQLLMIGGLDRYFQIATCFRDEDLRADRQPEFSQIDVELSFGSSEDLFPIIEKLMMVVFGIMGMKIDLPIMQMSYYEAMDKYGTDKPDLRFDLLLQSCENFAKKTSFEIFRQQLMLGGLVKGFRVPGGADISRKQLDYYTDFVKRYGAQGLVWIRYQSGDVTSNILKFADKNDFYDLATNFNAEDGDSVFLIAAPKSVANQALDHLRRLIAKDRNLYSDDQYKFVWITDFPLFAEEEGKMSSEHHPFTSPLEEDISLLDENPLNVRSSGYDLVLNGYEIASGSQRIHDSVLQAKIFELLGLSKEEIHHKFGFLVEALSYGVPPHLGIALGLDRIIMILSNSDSIREVIAFPKTQKAADVMSGAPGEIEIQQLKELHIKELHINVRT
ncbi:MAG: aspartate--tRNA ligase [Victivallaceae bacterium]